MARKISKEADRATGPLFYLLQSSLKTRDDIAENPAY